LSGAGYGFQTNKASDFTRDSTEGAGYGSGANYGGQEHQQPDATSAVSNLQKGAGGRAADPNNTPDCVELPTRDELTVDEEHWRYMEAFRREKLESICGTRARYTYDHQAKQFTVESVDGSSIADLIERVVALMQYIASDVVMKTVELSESDWNSPLKTELTSLADQAKCVIYFDYDKKSCRIVGPRTQAHKLQQDISQSTNRYLLEIHQTSTGSNVSESFSQLPLCSTDSSFTRHEQDNEGVSRESHALDEMQTSDDSEREVVCLAADSNSVNTRNDAFNSTHPDASYQKPPGGVAEDSVRHVSYAGNRLEFVTDAGISVEIYRQNLLSEKVEAIVCPVDIAVSLSGGASAAIARAAGRDFEEACRKVGGLKTTCVTDVTAGSLRPQIEHVILASGPQVSCYPNVSELRTAVYETFYSCLQHANEQMKISSVSIPAVSSGKKVELE
jgi:Macro domain